MMGEWEEAEQARKDDEYRDRLERGKRVGTLPIDKEAEDKKWAQRVREIHENRLKLRKYS